MRAAAAALLLVVACRAPHQAAKPPAVVADNPAPRGRLGAEATPRRYQLEIRVDPDQASFSGRVGIDLDVRRPIRTVWLHGVGLEVERAELSTGGEARPAHATPGPDKSDLVGFSTGEPIRRGPAHLSIEYRGDLGSEHGLFRQKTGGRWYAFTDFEATDARRALFCFDDPQFKTRWKIALEIPSGMEGFANTPVARRRPIEGGFERLEFEPTPPLPSYLVAFAAGPFDVVDGPDDPLPLRAVVPRHAGPRAALALEVAPSLARILRDYVGEPIPFSKLDLVAVPQFDGAMENPGLMTFAAGILLTPKSAGAQRRRFLVGVVAHELSHFWFGDLVTLTWWNDLWLNEAFATYMSDVAVERLWPQRRGRLLEVADRRAAVRADRRLDAPPVRRKIERAADARGAFDAMTYRKGGAVLEMFAGYLGEKTFRAGLKRYLEAHAHKNATTADLARALSAAAGRDLGPALTSFVDRPGIPLVRAELRCDGGHSRLALSQRRLLAAYDAARASAAERGRRWTIPVCARFPEGDRMRRACTLLDQEQGELSLGDTCPPWVEPNAGDAGYYHAWMPPGQIDALLAGADLDEREAVGLLLSAEALLAAAELGPDRAFEIYAALAGRDEPAVAEVVGDGLRMLSRAVVTPSTRKEFAARIRRLYGDRARRLGLVSARGESEETRALRWQLVSLVGGLGEDPDLRRRARERAEAWLAAGTGVRDETDLLALRLAARGGDEALFDHLFAAFGRATHRGRKLALAGALGSFSDPKLVRRALELVLDDEIGPPAAPALLGAALRGARSRDVAFALLNDRRAELGPHLEKALPPRILAPLCSERAAQEVRGWTGYAHAHEVADEIARCAAFARAQTGQR